MLCCVHCQLIVFSLDHIFNDLNHPRGVNLLPDVVVKSRREILVIVPLLILLSLHLPVEIFTVASECLLRLDELHIKIEPREESLLPVHHISVLVNLVEQKPESQTVFLARNVKPEIKMRLHLFKVVDVLRFDIPGVEVLETFH